MARCEDYPCCGHGPAPLGDGGGCPDAEGRFNCATCGRKLERNARSAICKPCIKHQSGLYSDDMTGQDQEAYS